MNRRTAAYLDAYKAAQDGIKALQAAIHDLPAPESEIEITWGHVGEMERIAANIKEITPKQEQPIQP